MACHTNTLKVNSAQIAIPTRSPQWQGMYAFDFVERDGARVLFIRLLNKTYGVQPKGEPLDGGYDFKADALPAGDGGGV
jgi:hypothetical protein